MTARKLAFLLAALVAAAGVGNAGRVLAQAAEPTLEPALPPDVDNPQAEPAEPPVPRYRVEVLIFAHRDFNPAEELFAHEIESKTPLQPEPLRAPPVFDDTNLGVLAQEPSLGGAPVAQPPALGQAPAIGQPPALGQPPAQGQQPAVGEEPALGQEPPLGTDFPLTSSDLLAADPNQFRFRLLQPEELELTNQYRIIERNSQAYVPLLHGGWVQPGLPESASRPFDLAWLGATNPIGSIRLYLSRFLHVDLDLSYSDATAPVTPSTPALGNELTEVALPPRYRLVADRPTRSNELHYFDHPAFGVLIRVSPVRDEPVPGAPGTRPAA